MHQIKEWIGNPIYERDNVLLYHGDCLQLMSKCKDQCFNLTATSPPYNIGKEYEQILPLPQYLNWCENWVKEVYRLTEFDGAFWLNLGYLSLQNKANAIPIPYLLWERVPFFLMQEIVWNYGAGVACKKTFSPRNEKFLWYVKNKDKYTFNLDSIRDPNVKYPNQKKNGKLKCNSMGKNPTDVWQFPKVTSGKNRSSKERTSHPAQFPVAVIKRIILACSNVGDVVLDPFLGSGTTAEVAISLGRKVVGIEINRDYIGNAIKRIEKSNL